MSSAASETRSTGAAVSSDTGFRQVRDLSDTISTGFRFIRAHASGNGNGSGHGSHKSGGHHG